ncbi:Predicted secreted protein [Rhizobium sp. RU35A]|uniref:DUF1467 family protein n=1 Tax=Rhizobium straminoryzae TaxID=1387186 RepID=A0A549TIT9_9HYPH|nr:MULTISPECIES: DUF1467 family protein [Rhizobium]TRL43449.1 DUF1467 family protein [Rhizobium straminoryzae]SIP89353.1 Predicted secreted protein [Rhizobium sp. RU35A]
MSLMLTFASYFIVWWITFIALLPFGLRTQADENDVVLGTEASAPVHFRGGRVVLLTTVISATLYGIWYWLAVRYGLSLGNLPRIVPDFGHD